MPRILTLPGAERDIEESMAFYARSEPGVELRFKTELLRAYEGMGKVPSVGQLILETCGDAEWVESHSKFSTWITVK